VFGVISYALSFAAYTGLHKKFFLVNIDSDPIVFSARIAREVAYTTLIAFAASLIHVRADSKRYLSNTITWLGITRKYGTEDVWDYTFSRGDPSASFIHLRDFEKKIIYAGYVLRFSESEKLRELVLAEVAVYSFEGDELFTAPRVYIARDKEDIDIAFPVGPETPDVQSGEDDGGLQGTS